MVLIIWSNLSGIAEDVARILSAERRYYTTTGELGVGGFGPEEGHTENEYMGFRGYVAGAGRG